MPILGVGTPTVGVLDCLRVECAFTTTPDDPYPAFQDISAYVDLTTGISITAGRTDEHGNVQAGTCRVSLDNTDGRFTAGRASSPYYPNVKIRKKLRVSWRDPTVPGNILDVPSASFEDGSVGGWFTQWLLANPSALTNSTTRAHDGTHSLLVTWNAGAAGSASATWAGQIVLGRTYTFSVWVFVPTGGPAVKVSDINGSGVGSTSSTTNAWQQLSMTWTPTSATVAPSVVLAATATTGQTVYVDQAMLDEGSTVGSFTTANAIRYRFTGFVEEWPTEWPTGGDTYSLAEVTAVDRFKRMGRTFKSIIEEEYNLDKPVRYYTLGEATGSTTAGDTSGNAGSALVTTPLGAGGGSLTFGANTGPGTDGLPAPAFTPASTSNGLYLSGTCIVGGGSASTLEAFMLTSAAVDQNVAMLTNGLLSLQLGTTAAGKATVTDTNGSGVADFTLTSAASVNDGLTHHLAVTQSVSGTTVTVTLYVDGVSAGTTTYASPNVDGYIGVRIGGAGLTTGLLFNGTIAHVAAYSTALTAARLLAHRQSGSTGFSGERSDQRIARYATYAGVPTSEQSLEVGLTTSVAFVDITGTAGVQAMQDVTDTENGFLFVDGQGLLTFHARSHRYNTSSSFTVTSGDVDQVSRFTTNDLLMVNDVTASRPGGVMIRATDPASLSDYGTTGSSAIQVTLLTTSDNEVASAANWLSHQNSQINPRLPNLTMDLLTSPGLVASALVVRLGARVTLSGLPVQAPASSVDLFVEGWTENISNNAWSLVWNTSPASKSTVWVLGSATYGLLKSTTTLAY